MTIQAGDPRSLDIPKGMSWTHRGWDWDDEEGLHRLCDDCWQRWRQQPEVIVVPAGTLDRMSEYYPRQNRMPLPAGPRRILFYAHGGAVVEVREGFCPNGRPHIASTRPARLTDSPL